MQIQTESQQPKTVRAKFKSNTQNKYDTLKSASEKSGTSLLEILRKSSMHAERCVQNNQVQQTESVFASFKLAKKPIKTEGRVWCSMWNFGILLDFFFLMYWFNFGDSHSLNFTFSICNVIYYNVVLSITSESHNRLDLSQCHVIMWDNYQKAINPKMIKYTH